jgi:hemoglobin
VTSADFDLDRPDLSGSVYDRLGGAAALDLAVDRFYRAVTADPLLRSYFEGVDLARLRRHQVAFLRAALGGPGSHRGRPLAAAHAGLGVTDADFDRVAGHLAAVLTGIGAATADVDAVVAAVAPLRADVVTGVKEAAGDPRR